MPKTYFLLVALCLLAGIAPLNAQHTDCERLLREAASFEKNKQYDRAMKKYLSAKEECDAATSAEVNRKVLAVFEKIEQQRQEAETAKRQAEANAARALNAERSTLLEKQKAEHSSEANRLAALALSKAKENPTLGRHLAAMAWEKSLDPSGQFCTEPGVASVMHSISSDPDAWVYRPFKAHVGGVYDIAYSPDGKTLVTCGADSTLRLWNMEGKPLWAVKSQEILMNVAFSPDGKLIISTGRDSVYLWNSSDGISKHIAHSQKGMLAPSVFSPDNKHLLIVQDTSIIWDIETGSTVRKLSSSFLDRDIFMGQYSHDGSLILMGGYSNSGYINFVLIDTLGRIVDTLWGKKTHASEVRFTPDGKKLVVAKSRFIYFKDIETRQLDSIPMLYSSYKIGLSERKNKIVALDYTGMIIYDYSSLQTTSIPSPNPNVLAGKLFFANDDQFIVSSANDGSIGFYNTERNSFVNFRIHDRHFALKVSPDGNMIASAGMDGKVLLWQRNMTPLVVAQHLYISPDGQRMATSEIVNRNIRINLLDAETNLVATLDAPFYNSIQREDIQFIPNSNQLLVNCRDSTIRIWDYNGNMQHTIRSKEHDITFAKISPSGERILGISQLGTIQVWDNKGAKVGTFEIKNWNAYFYFDNVKFSPDGSHFYVRGDTTIYLVDKNGTLLAQINERPSLLGFSPAGHLWANIDYPDFKFKVWDKKGKLLIDAPKAYRGVFSSDGKFLAVTFENQQVMVWDVAKQRSQTWATPALVENLAFGTNGLLYLSSSAYAKPITYLLDDNGREVGRFSGSLPGISGNFLFPDGRVLGYKTKNGKIEYLQVLDKNSRITQVLEGLPNIEGHDISADGRYKLAWSRDKVIVWDDNGRPLRTFTNPPKHPCQKAYFTADNRYIVVESHFGSQLWENPTTYIRQSKTLSISDLLKAGAGVSKDSVLASNDPDILAEVADFYFYDRNEPNDAETFYERLESVRHTPQTLMNLYDIAQQTGRTFDNRRFLQSSNTAELSMYANYLMNKKQWEIARTLFEKSVSIKASGANLFQLNMIADTLSQPFDLGRFDALSDNPNELGMTAYSYYAAEKWHQARHLYELAEQKAHSTEYLLQLYRISEKTQEAHPDFNRFLSSENAYELQRYGDFFFKARQWAKAQSLFEKATQIQLDNYALHRLQTIADSLGQAFDFERFMMLKDTNDLMSSADFFFNRRDWEKAQRLYHKANQMGAAPNSYTFARMIALSAKTGAPMDISWTLISVGTTQEAANNFLQPAVIEIHYYAADTLNSNAELMNYLSVLRLLEDKLFAIDTSSRLRQQIAQRYTSIAWQHLFTLRENHAVAVEMASKRGLEIAPDETTIVNKVLRTNIPTSLVLQGRFEEAWRNWYEPLKGQEYGRNNYPTFREVFLGDIKNLEEAGVKHPDFEKVKTRLKAGNGG